MIHLRGIRHGRRVLAMVALAVAALSLGTAARASTGVAPSGRQAPKLLPDLVTLTPKDLRVQTSGSTKLLRFSNEIGNDDTGPLEVFPKPGNDCNGNGDPTDDRLAYQRIYRDTNGNGRFDRGIDTAAKPILAGCMVFHPEHDHWHFEGFARYDLKDLAGNVLVTAEKVSFCMVDTDHPFPGVPGSPQGPYFVSCDATHPMGMSAGWADTYGWYLPGQDLDITGLADGVYCLVTTADPENRLLETDDTNNAFATKLQIVGTQAKDLHLAC